MNPVGAGEWLNHLRCEILLSRGERDPTVSANAARIRCRIRWFMA